MPSSPWTWDGSHHGNSETGRFIGPKDMLKLRDQFAEAEEDEARRITAEPWDRLMPDYAGLLDAKVDE